MDAWKPAAPLAHRYGAGSAFPQAAEQAYAAAKAAVDALQTQQATAETAGPAQPLEELQARQTRLTAARSTLREQAQQLAAQLLPNCAAAEKYRAAAAARTQLEQRWQW